MTVVPKVLPPVMFTVLLVLVVAGTCTGVLRVFGLFGLGNVLVVVSCSLRNALGVATEVGVDVDVVVVVVRLQPQCVSTSQIISLKRHESMGVEEGGGGENEAT